MGPSACSQCFPSMPLSRWSDLLRTCWAPSCGYFMVFHMVQRDDFLVKQCHFYIFLPPMTGNCWINLYHPSPSNHYPTDYPEIIQYNDWEWFNLYIPPTKKCWCLGGVHWWHRFPHTFHQHPGTSDSTWIAAGLDLAGREPAQRLMFDEAKNWEKRCPMFFWSHFIIWVFKLGSIRSPC